MALGSPGERLQLKCGLGMTPASVIRKKCLVDTGAGLNAVPLQLAWRQSWPIDESVRKRVKAFNNSVETSIGSVSVDVQLGSSPVLHVIDFDVLESATQVILLLSSLAKMDGVVECSKSAITIDLPHGSKRSIFKIIHPKIAHVKP